LTSNRLPSLVAAFLEGRDLELLQPLRFDAAADGNVRLGPRPAVDRKELAEALGRANEGYGHRKARELAEKLARPDTRVVITGQQPGLFGGPLYTLSKAVAAQLWAEKLERRGESAVALFWMATEDHDFKESSEVTFFTPRGSLEVSLGEDREPLVPVGLRRLGPELERVSSELSDAVPGDRFAEWLQRMKSWYHPEATFGDAFAGLMGHLLGERSPLWVDALLPELKQAQIPLLRSLVERRSEVTAAYSSRDREIEQRGYPLQIRPQPDAGPLFVLVEEQRRRVLWRSEGRVGLRGLDTFDESVGWLLDVIETDPGRVSPGARARVAIQDALFGSDLLILGPGELSYLPQAAPLYDLFSLTPPTVALRPQAIVLEGHQLDKLASTRVGLEAFTSTDLDLDRALVDSESTRFLDLAGEDLEGLLERLRRPALDIDANLDNPLSKTGDQMKRALEAFSGKVAAAASRRDQVARQRAESLRRVCMPGGENQERVIATAHFPGKHGDRFVSAMFEHLKLDPRYLRVIQP